MAVAIQRLVGKLCVRMDTIRFYNMKTRKVVKCGLNASLEQYVEN